MTRAPGVAITGWAWRNPLGASVDEVVDPNLAH